MSIDLDEISRRKNLADFYFDNYQKYKKAKKYQKASEFLWGALNNLVYALGIIYGEKINTHSKTKDFINYIASIYTPKIAQLLRK